MFYVEFAHWTEGQGWEHTEYVDKVDKRLTQEELKAGYNDFCKNAGDEIRLLDEKDNVVEVYKCDMYKVVFSHWTPAGGWNYNKTIDNVKEPLTAEELKQAYGYYCFNAGDEIILYDSDYNRITSYEEI